MISPKTLARESNRVRQPSGFALVVTVSILVLLALIAVGILSLSTITVRTSSLSNAQVEARNNARLALMLAIADLQKAAGPDQRITTTADIAGAIDGDALGSGQAPANGQSLDGSSKGLTMIQSGTRYWTGVFQNRDSPNRIFDKTPSARVNRWLVSGVQDPDASEPEITPNFPACAVSADGTVSDPTQAAVLVGPNTVGDGSQDDFVAAPMVSVNSNSGGGSPRGGYAYWIGDEGVKARINMERTNEDAENYGSLVAQRRGWETVDGFEDYPEPIADGDRALPGIVTLPTAEILMPAIEGGNPSPSQSVFHAATADSKGLVVDTLNGGTRVDLTAAFSKGLSPAAPLKVYDNYPYASGRVIPEINGRSFSLSGLRHLKWDHLQDFCNRGKALASNGTLKVTSRSAPDKAAIAPLIVDFRILMGVRIQTIRGQSQKYFAHPCGKIAVAIANPYGVPLEWDEDLEFEVVNQTPSGNRPSRIWQLNSTAVYVPKNPSEPAVFNQAVFLVKPGRLEPGEARAYTVADKVVRPRARATVRQEVDLAPFGSAAPFDFNRCVEMTTTNQITLPKTMDVRESWQTTLVKLEMRLGGSRGGYDSWLRRLEGFELDNGYFGPNQRRFDSSNSSRSRGPVPLMLYSFQISQPGMDYMGDRLMPNGYEMGQRSSTLRTFTDFNLQASNIHAPIASYNPPPYFMESNDSAGQLGPITAGGNTGQGFTRNLAADPLNWGFSSKEGSEKTVLFAVPREFTSLAQFQHADLTNDDQFISIGHQPGNAFANSYATPFVKRAVVQQERTDYVIMGSPNKSGAFTTKRKYYDISHVLNNSLWDRYFFSSTSDYAEGGRDNPTLITALGTGDTDFNDPVEAAGGLMINGAFNINSTNKDAWKAFLASSKHLDHLSETGASADAAFPRSLEQPSPHQVPPTGRNDDSFGGYRRLTDDELEALSIEIVRQVRRRGPFVSLSHFVNRALADINEEKELTRCGALQFALDESGINISHDGSRKAFTGVNAVRDRVTLAEKEGSPRADLDGGDRGGRPTDAERDHPDWAVTSRDNNFGAVASIVADRQILKKQGSSRGDLSREQGYRSTGIPGWVTQADVLQVIGPAISARSDTFRIRTLGEARDGSGKVIATAYCEAIVQRQPYYVDPSNEPHDRGDTLTTTNQTYGRKFEIVSFRWLSSTEI